MGTSFFLAPFIPRKLLWIFAGSKSAEKKGICGKMHFSQIPMLPQRGGTVLTNEGGKNGSSPY